MKYEIEVKEEMGYPLSKFPAIMRSNESNRPFLVNVLSVKGHTVKVLFTALEDEVDSYPFAKDFYLDDTDYCVLGILETYSVFPCTVSITQE